MSNFITRIQKSRIAALFVCLAWWPLRQSQVGDGHVVQRGHYDAAGDALGDRLVAVARVRLVGDLIEVEVHGSLADAEDGGDLPGGLALAGPEQALLLPIRQLGQVFHQVWPGLDEGQGRRRFSR